MFFTSFFVEVLNMSFTASVAIAVVLLLRLLLQRAPKNLSYALWGVVLFRLLCPFSFRSGFSLFGLLDAPVSAGGDVVSRMASLSSAVMQLDGLREAQALGAALPQSGAGKALTAAACVWLTGVVAMALRAAMQSVRLRRTLAAASRLRDNVYLTDEIVSPFFFFLLRPKIYLPSSLDEHECAYIIAHEQHHIRRMDHVVKLLAFAALCIHWFNPLVWLAFLLASRDMEMSCDEAVVRKMGDGILTDYAASLLSLATGKRIIAGAPLAFGAGDTKGRIRNLAGRKKPKRAATFAVCLIAIFAAAALAFDPLAAQADEPTLPDETVKTENSARLYELTIGPGGAAEIRYGIPTYCVECIPEDGGRFLEGDSITLELPPEASGLRGMTVTALNARGEIIWSASVPDEKENADFTSMTVDGWTIADLQKTA